MNIIDKMLEDKVASNVFQARHIAEGLRLSDLRSDEAKIRRYKLYRAWRNTGEPSKVSFVKAIAGLVPGGPRM